MPQLEQKFRAFLNRHPEVRATFFNDILNLRGLARFFLKEEHLNPNKLEAAIAMIRRLDVEPLLSFTNKDIFKEIKISTKDDIVILDYEKSKDIVQKINKIVGEINYDQNETLNVVVGTQTVKIFVDARNTKPIKEIFGKDNLRREFSNISEISLLFSQKALNEKGVIANITSELLMNGINICELITCTPELIIYFDDKQSLRAYEVLKRIKNG